MVRLARKQAGTEVAERADRFSDDLLAVEHETFTAMRDLFAAERPGVLRLVESTAARGLLELGQPIFSRRVTSTLNRVLDGCQQRIDSLLDEAASMSITSVHDELFACELTLSSRFGGVTGQARALLDEQLPEIRDEAAGRVGLDFSGIVARFAGRWDDSLRAWLTTGEFPEQLVYRMLSPEPVRLPGHGGRGLWWQTLSQTQAVARSRCVDLANVIRQATMDVWNRAAAAR